MDGARYQALGISAEMLLTARLLELGLKVAIPVTDDDGIDLIVNYGIKVQVKSTAYRRQNGHIRVKNYRGSRGGRAMIATHVDIIAVYARDTRTWWFIPRDDFRSQIELIETKPVDPWREDWTIFDRMGGLPPRENHERT